MGRALGAQARRLSYRTEIDGLLGRIERSANLWALPKRAEYEFCGFLAAWEATALRSRRASRWREIWKRVCLEHHRGKPNLTLADPVGRPAPAERWEVPADETPKAYRAVSTGMRQVFNAILDEYHLPRRIVGSSPSNEVELLQQLIEDTFRTGKSYACPEGLESLLLTLTGLLERALGRDEKSLSARQRWHAEISRKRSLGPPATRTLADVVPLNERLRRLQFFSESERTAIVRSMLTPMRQISMELGLYIRGHSPHWSHEAAGQP